MKKAIDLKHSVSCKVENVVVNSADVNVTMYKDGSVKQFWSCFALYGIVFPKEKKKKNQLN